MNAANVFPVNIAPKMNALKIKFSGTIDPRPADDPRIFKERFHHIKRFREALIPRNLCALETVGWNRVKEISDNLGSDFRDEDCSIHYSLHFPDPQDPKKISYLNLANTKDHVFTDTSNTFYEFLSAHNRVRNISQHLACSADKIEERDQHGVKPIPFIAEGGKEFSKSEILDIAVPMLNLFAQNVRSLGFTGPLLLENCPWEGLHVGGTYRSALNHVGDANFIRDVMKATGYGLLLDVSHAYIHAFCAMNYSDNPRSYDSHLSYIKDLLGADNIDQLHEIHAAVPEKRAVPAEIRSAAANSPPEHIYDMHLAFCKTAGQRIHAEILDIIKHIIQLRREHGIEGLPELVINFEHDARHWLKDAAVIAELIDRIAP